MMRVLLALLLVLCTDASAQQREYFWAGCMQGVGVAAGRVEDQRDWDFTTPGPVAYAGSPVYTTACIGYAPPQPSVTWFGVDLMPTYLHSYRGLRERLPLLLEANWGRGWYMVGRQFWGVQVVSNGLAFGGGLRYAKQFGYKGGGVRPGLGISVNALYGVEWDWQVVITHQQWRGWPRYRNERRKHSKVHLGFEIGPVMTVRAQVPVKKQTGSNHPAHVGMRLGTVTFPLSNTALQPLILPAFQFELPPHRTFKINDREMRTRLELNAGTTLRDNVLIPAGGVAFLLYGQERGSSKTRFGIVGGTNGFWSPDVSMGWVW